MAQPKIKQYVCKNFTETDYSRSNVIAKTYDFPKKIFLLNKLYNDGVPVRDSERECKKNRSWRITVQYIIYTNHAVLLLLLFFFSFFFEQRKYYTLIKHTRGIHFRALTIPQYWFFLFVLSHTHTRAHITRSLPEIRLRYTIE